MKSKISNVLVGKFIFLVINLFCSVAHAEANFITCGGLTAGELTEVINMVTKSEAISRGLDWKLGDCLKNRSGNRGRTLTFGPYDSEFAVLSSLKSKIAGRYDRKKLLIKKSEYVELIYYGFQTDQGESIKIVLKELPRNMLEGYLIKSNASGKVTNRGYLYGEIIHWDIILGGG